MNFLPSFSVGQRVGLAFAILVLLVVSGGGLGLYVANTSTTTVVEARDSLLLIEDVAELQRTWGDVTSAIDSMLLTRQTGLVQESLNENLALFNIQLAEMAEVSMGAQTEVVAENEEIFRQVSLFAVELNDIARQIDQLADSGRWAQGQALRHTELSSFQRRFDQALEQLATNVEEDVNSAVLATVRTQAIAERAWQIMTVLALVAAAVMGLVVAQSVVRPVQQLTAGAERLAGGRFSERVELKRRDELGQLADAFNMMAAQLQQYYEELEQRVSDRTQALRATTEVSRLLSTILQEQDLIKTVVEEVQRAYGYYHVHIYLFDENRQNLTLVGGTGQPAREMVARGHSLEAGRGLVGRAAATNKAVLIPDVLKNPDWLPNSLLPDTKAEAAVPIAFAGGVLGVLDVQHNVAEGLTETDIEMLEAVASQVAIALQNARLVEEARERVDQAVIVSTIGQRIQRATTIEEVLQVAARELGQVLKVESARVQLGQQAVVGNRERKRA